MSASNQAKAAGLTSLAEVSQITQQSVQTLTNWYKDKPELFRIVILGCAVEKHKATIKDLLK